MPGEPRWSYYKPQAWAVVGGVTTDVVRLQIDYALNTIPQCQLWLPTGRDVRSGAAAAIHALVADLTEQVPIQVYARLTPHAQSDRAIRGLQVPAGDFLIFDGFTAGGGYARSQGAAQYTLAANGWPVLLNQASALSDTAHPGNPARYISPAILRGGDSGAEESDWTVITQARTFASADNLAQDVWGAALYPWLDHLTRQDGIWAAEQNLDGGDGTNRQAKASLDRLRPVGGCYRPLVPRDTLMIDVDLAAAIAEDIALSTHDASFTANQTLWDILVGHFAPDYLFAVVPRVRDGLVVPYIPCYRGPGGRAFETLRAGEIARCELSMTMPRPLRAVGILSGLATYSGVSGYDDDAPNGMVVGIGGWFNTVKSGTVRIERANRWMSQALAVSDYAAPAVGGDLEPGGNAFQPGVGVATDARIAGQARAEGPLRHLLDAYAQARYAQEVLQGRYGVVSGALRFDVAPGSLVRVEGATELLLPAAADRFGQPYFGEVLRVSIALDAEAPAAGTAFHLGQVRTERENDDRRTSVAEHPLYTESFRGCRLVDP